LGEIIGHSFWVKLLKAREYSTVQSNSVNRPIFAVKFQAMKKIAVVGAGQMGNGIAHVFAQTGYPVNLIDVKQDRATGRIVAGDASAPQQAVEVWTFLRPAGAGPQDWKLSAIQQAS
jgi:predicted lipid-binding transport protein (Tim44 family)